MKKIFPIIISLLVLLSARAAFASTALIPSAWTSAGGWVILDNTDAVVSCPAGTDAWEQFYNSTSESGPAPYICISPPWVSTSNLDAFFLAHGNNEGDSLTYEFFNGGTPVGHVSIVYLGTGYLPITSTSTTRFTAIHISTTTQNFQLEGYISPTDENVHINFNVSTPVFSQWDHGDFTATTTGFFSLSIPYQNFSTSTIDSFTFTGTLLSPSSDPFTGNTPPSIYDTISTTTNSNGIGLTNLPTPNETLKAVAENCSPFSGFFNVASCASYLFFPDTVAASNNVTFLKDNLLTKFPLGYITRFYTILSGHATTSIPELSYTWANDGGPLAGKTLAFDVDSYMVQAKGLTEEMVSNTDQKNVYDIFMPFINLFLAIVVFYNLIEDIMGIPLSGSSGRAEGAKINSKGGIGTKKYGPDRGDFNQSK